MCKKKKKKGGEKEKKSQIIDVLLLGIIDHQHTVPLFFFLRCLCLNPLLIINSPLECTPVKVMCTAKIKGVFRGHDEIPNQNLNEFSSCS